MNRKAAQLIEWAQDLPPGSNIVEIGSIRTPAEVPSDGWSTYYLAELAVARNWNLTTIDTDQNALDATAAALGPLVSAVDLVNSRASEWLESNEKTIDLLYMDGDSDIHVNLDELIKAYPQLGRIVVIDDVQDFGIPAVLGKASLVIPTLLRRGWTVEARPTEPGYFMAHCYR